MGENKKGMEFAIWVLVVLILALLVFGVLALALTGEWKKFWDKVKGYSGSDIDNLEKICKSQCDLTREEDFCCGEKMLGKEKINCTDGRLEVECDINCGGIC